MKTRKILKTACMAVLLFAVLFLFGLRARYSLIREERSGDGRLEMRVYKDIVFWGMPGSGSDAQGFCVIRDGGTAKILGVYYLEMVFMAFDLRWEMFEFDEKGRIVERPPELCDFWGNAHHLVFW